jgi:hypothetical protein
LCRFNDPVKVALGGTEGRFRGEGDM